MPPKGRKRAATQTPLAEAAPPKRTTTARRGKVVPVVPPQYVEERPQSDEDEPELSPCQLSDTEEDVEELEDSPMKRSWNHDAHYPTGFGAANSGNQPQNLVTAATGSPIAGRKTKVATLPRKPIVRKESTLSSAAKKRLPKEHKPKPLPSANLAQANAAAFVELWFVHPDIIQDVLDATGTGMEGVALRWHCRVMMLKKRNIESNDRALVMSLIEQNARGIFKNEEMTKLTQTLKNRVSHDMEGLRKQFDAATKQFFEDPDTQSWRTWFTNWVRMGKGFKGISEPFIQPDELQKCFVKDNMKLVADIWAPLLAVTPAGFLFMPEHQAYARSFLAATIQILCDFITIQYKSEGTSETQAKTQAIKAADVHMPDDRAWPHLAKPAVWRKTNEKVVWYGELKNSGYHAGMTRGDVQDLVEDQVTANVKSDPDSAVAVPATLPSEYIGRDTSELIDYIKALCKRDISALDVIITEAQHRQSALLKKLTDMENWVQEKYRLADSFIEISENGPASYEHSLKQALEMIQNAKEQERTARIEANGVLPADHIPVRELVHNFRAFSMFVRTVGKDFGVKEGARDTTVENTARHLATGGEQAVIEIPDSTPPLQNNTFDANPMHQLDYVEETPPPPPCEILVPSSAVPAATPPRGRFSFMGTVQPTPTSSTSVLAIDNRTAPVNIANLSTLKQILES
ncbi:hypothetical protein EDC01DRAFT_632696 [Geopyxis carbonaria]|nr:hypothetical protein EDC01DRAFT_632696 [Geopyxis carbonaria]